MAGAAPPAYTARPGEAVRVFRSDDGSFAVGMGRVRIAVPDSDTSSVDMSFVAAVIDDLGRLAHLPAGEEALRRGDAMGRPVVIVKPFPPTDPANAWTIPDDLAAASLSGLSVSGADGGAVEGAGTGCGSTIAYNPADWPERGSPDRPGRIEILLMLFDQANANAAGRSNPLLPEWGVPRR